MTRTESYSGRVIRMLCQLVEKFSVERASVKFTKKYIKLINILIRSRLRVTKIKILHSIKLQLQLLNVENTFEIEELHQRENFSKISNLTKNL